MDRSLFLFIKDPRVFYYLLEKLKEKHIPYYILDNPHKLPYRNIVITTDTEGINEITRSEYYHRHPEFYTFVNYEDYGDYDALLINIIRELWDVRDYSVFMCSIDPGQIGIGLAYFLDKKLLITEVVHEPNEAIRRIIIYTEGLNPKFLKIKIGTGNLRSLRDILNLLLREENAPIQFRNARIILIDEYGSTKNKYYYKKVYNAPFLSKHERAAINIGIRHGRDLTSDAITYILEKKANPAELKHIQRLSRKKSSGRISVSRKLAEEIYNGKISLEEAIRIQEEKNGGKNGKSGRRKGKKRKEK